MRLLVVSQYFWPEEFRINELTAALVSRGHEVTVLTGVPNYPSGTIFPDYAASPKRFSSYCGARVVRVFAAARGTTKSQLLFNYLSFAFAATICGLVSFRHERFDAVLVFEPSPVTVGVPAVMFRLLRGWPIAFWVLDQWPETLAAVGGVRSKGILWCVGLLVSWIYQRCNVILSPSRSLTVQIARYCRDGQSIEYFPNWVESGYEKSASPAPEVDERRDLFNVMFAGNIGDSQDFPAILDAVEELRTDPRVRWLIVGDGRTAPWVRQQVRNRGLQDQVLLLGRYDSSRMPSFFRHADALLVSLKADPVFTMTIPGKVQTYLASGLPVLAMLDGEGARVVNDAQAGLTCASGDARKLALNVRRLASLSAVERIAMGQRGRAYARREFGREILVTRMESILTKIAGCRD